MTYVPPERDDADALDQTQQFNLSPQGLPAVGNGVDPQSASPVDPFSYPDDTAVAPAGFEDRKPPRDRLVFQFIWEAILLLLALNALFLVYRRQDEIFGEEFGSLADAADAHALYLAPILLVAIAFGLSLRLGAVNLAIPAVVIITADAPAIAADPWIHLGFTLALGAAAGLVFTLLVAAFRVPAWFAGLAVGIAVWSLGFPIRRFTEGLEVGEFQALGNPGGLWLFLGAAVLAIGGGFIALAPSVREGFSAVKGMADGQRSASAVFALLGGSVLSMVLAAGAGFLMFAFELQPSDVASSLNFGMYGPGPAAMDLQLLAFIAVLLGGTSLWGRRGGVFGTVLGTVGLWAGLLLWAQTIAAAGGEGSWQAGYSQAIYAGVLLVALFVSFGLDRLGRPKEDIEPDEFGQAQDVVPFDAPNGAPAGTGLFDPTLPEASPTPR